MTTDQPAAPHKPRVAIVFGGRSSEHAVSCATAAGVMRAIDRDAYDIVPIGISRDGHWVLSDGDPQQLELTSDRTPEVSPEGAAVVVPLATTDRTLVTLEAAEVPRSLGEVDVVFP
ncbi:MAG: D-alanine--D-alanine ligase A, partial [Pedococcus sp.]